MRGRRQGAEEASTPLGLPDPPLPLGLMHTFGAFVKG